ncbi:MAG: tripartite tricarboxylate transporter substrate binding protein [Acetobacteraceae bacterium]|nr:tripartite tricarboxylate transporter substrate binding protein [Acetobacteraceae bacterium]
MTTRRSLLLAAPALALTGGLASAQAWPTRPVRIIIPFTPGGASDIAMRPVAARLEQLLGQPFVIDNRAGGGGAIGIGAAANERPDGYTLMLSTPGPLILLPMMQSGIPYSAARSFTYVSLIAGAPILCAVAGNSPIRSLRDYAEAARRAPEAVSFGSSGIGSMGHLTGVLFGMETNARLLHAPFRGAPEAQQGVLGGSITSLWDTASANAAAARAGNLRGLCVSSPERAVSLPDVPTARELGFGNVVSLNWFLFGGPAGLPAPIVERLATAVRQVLAEPRIREGMDNATFVGMPEVAPGQLGAWVEDERAKWEPVVRAAG